MMVKTKILKLSPHFEYRVWANNKLERIFNLDQKSIGEAWVISCFENKSSMIENLENRISLFDFYSNPENAYFFNSYNIDNKYPLLAKLIDAKDDLSVQIHPDNEYAKKENSLGKTESWYIIETKENNSIVLGHNAKTIDEFKQMVKNNKWDKLLKEKQIKKGDFIYVPSKKIHAIKSDTFVYELQQSSDITYRVYDYNRLDNGKLRDLHLDDVYNLVQYPDIDLDKSKITNDDKFLVSNEMFKLILINNIDLNEYHFDDANWLQVTIIEGNGNINGINAKQFDSFLICHKEKLVVDGNCKCLVSWI